MLSHWLLRFDLHRLILALAVLGVLATFGNSFYAIHQAQRQLLIDSTLEANRVYAAKLLTEAGPETLEMLAKMSSKLDEPARKALGRMLPHLEGDARHKIDKLDDDAAEAQGWLDMMPPRTITD